MATAAIAKKPKRKTDLAEKVKLCIQARERGKKMYARSDAYLAEILKEIDPGAPIALNDNGKVAVIKDKLADGKTSAFCPAFFRRYELEVEDR